MEAEEVLKLLNGWWKSGKVGGDLAKKFRRTIFGNIDSLLRDYKEVVVLSGLRRVGKTTIMYQLINGLLSSVNSLNVVYFSFDLGSEELYTILNSYQKITNVDWKSQRIYLFLDEIQKEKNWAAQLKLIYDTFPNLRFVVSGSASLQLEEQALENLVGRFFLVEVPVLSLVEYYSLKNNRDVDNLRLYEEEIKMEFDSYIKKPFPGLVEIEEESRIYEYLRETVISKILGQDVINEFDKVEIPLLTSLVNLFYSEPGMILNFDSLSRSLNKRKETLERHVFMLEFSKLIRIVKNYRPSTMSESRKLKKVYPYDISLALSHFPSIEKGKIIETLMVARLDIKKYWKQGSKEVDALYGKQGEFIPIEIKSGNSVREESTSNLRYFISRFKCAQGVLLYNGKRIELGDIIAVDLKNVLLYGLEAVLK